RRDVLRQLRVDWPAGPAGTDLADAVSALKRALGRAPCAAGCGQGPGAAALPADVICKVRLKGFAEQQGLVGYDPNLDVLLGEPRCSSSVGLRGLEGCTQPGSLAGGQGSCCSIVHVVSCEEEFQQQQLDLLWRILDPGPHTALQKYLVCGPVKVTNPSSPIGAWTEVIDTLTAAAIRFEMLSTAHRSQITLDLQDSSISTKGTKSGAFVMYNCARLATLFDTFQRAVERGTYPPLPPPSELNFSCLREEGEWLLLFNYLLPFPEVLQQAAQLPAPTKGIRITANTEAVSAHTAAPLGLLLLCLGPKTGQAPPYQQKLCLAGVQVPDPAQHGFQLLLQPGARPGGKLGVPALQPFLGLHCCCGEQGLGCPQRDAALHQPLKHLYTG
uniref:DALR anticodon binding domain containing 3 n=1 Tax=Strigops habroptila TaxID=2489341 RepID=A0A672UVS9_STRHB